MLAHQLPKYYILHPCLVARQMVAQMLNLYSHPGLSPHPSPHPLLPKR